MRLSAELNRDLADHADMPLTEYEILVGLAEADDRTLRMAALAEATDLSRSRLTHAVARLERRGLVRRFTCDSDRRGVFCALTDRGEDLLAETAPSHLATVKRYFLDKYSPQELELLSGLLDRVLD